MMNDKQRSNMTKTGRWVAALVAVALVSTATLADAEAGEETFFEIDELLSSWQIREAGERLDEFTSEAEGTAHYDYLRGRYAFYTGEYDEAMDRMDDVVDAEDHPPWEQFRQMVAATVEVTEDYERHVSDSGNFEIYVAPGPDEVLVPFAIEALEEAYDLIGDELGHRPDEPVRVEVYPRETVLAQVSALTEENIRTSGTIALCEYNRLMITSPRAVLRGYSWVDTLVHEYIHLVINQRTTEQVPIWMHEGLAKYLERQWRGRGHERLDASSERLLRERHEDDDLVTFEEMHPSMAKLPSQQDAAVAFAQVYTTMEYLREEVGDDALSRLLDTIDEGHEARQAYARVLGTDWNEFENHEWRRHLHHRPLPDLPDDEDDMYEEEIVFDDEAGDRDPVHERVETPEAQEHMQLAQMFQVRERWGAAAVQYQKAEEIIGDKNPVLQTRMAKSLTHSGEPEKAVDALQTVKDLHPHHVETWLELGRAYLGAGNYHDARQALREAARINPFNPEIHELLSEAAAGLDRHDEAEEARRFARLVS